MTKEKRIDIENGEITGDALCHIASSIVEIGNRVEHAIVLVNTNSDAMVAYCQKDNADNPGEVIGSMIEAAVRLAKEKTGDMDKFTIAFGNICQQAIKTVFEDELAAQYARDKGALH